MQPADAFILPTETGAAVMFDERSHSAAGELQLEVYAPFELSPGEIDYLRAECQQRLASIPRPRARSMLRQVPVAIAELTILGLVVYFFIDAAFPEWPVLLVAVAAGFLPSSAQLLLRRRRRGRPGRILAAGPGLDGNSVQRIGQIWGLTASGQSPNHIDFENAARSIGWLEAAVFYRGLRDPARIRPLGFRAA